MITNCERVMTEVDPCKTSWEIIEELRVGHSTVVQHLHQINNLNKTYELSFFFKFTAIKSPLHIFCTTKLIHSLITLWHAENGFCIITSSIPHSIFTEVKYQNISFPWQFPKVGLATNCRNWMNWAIKLFHLVYLLDLLPTTIFHVL